MEFLFNMVDVIGFWKNKRIVTLERNQKAKALSGIDSPETRGHKSYFWIRTTPSKKEALQDGPFYSKHSWNW